MIRYALKCAKNHGFESWFQSAAAFDRLAAAGMVACPDCGNAKVTKSLMAPQVRPSRTAAATTGEGEAPAGAPATGAPAPGEAPKGEATTGKATPGKAGETGKALPEPASGALSTPANPTEQALTALRRHVEQTADYVGGNFVTEARRIHEGATPDRPIWGEARIDDARALIEEGIPVAALPFRPTRKSN